VALDSDVYWKSAPATGTDWYVTPTFHNSGETTLPPNLVLYNTVLRNGYSSAQGDAMWGQAMGRTNRDFPGSYVRHEDNANYSDVYRTHGRAYPLIGNRSGSNQEIVRSTNWGHLNDGRTVGFTQVIKTNSHYICCTSLRFNPMPWALKNFATPNSPDSSWFLNLGFAPDWVWAYRSYLHTDGGEWGTYYKDHGVMSETFSHRDGSIENWNYWDEDNQNTSDCGGNYSTSAFMDPWYNNATYNYKLGDITYGDLGITLDHQSTGSVYQGLTVLAGKNENSKVGHFRLSTSDYGDGVYRASDNTIKITTGFKPKMVFFLGGRRSSEGHTASVQQGRGFASENDQWAMSMSLTDNKTYTDVFHGNANNRCFMRLNYNSATGYDYCSLNAMEDDGFRLNLDDAGSYNVSYLALGDPPATVVLPYQSSILSV